VENDDIIAWTWETTCNVEITRIEANLQRSNPLLDCG
jgi:hypothetical protein